VQLFFWILKTAEKVRISPSLCGAASIVLPEYSVKNNGHGRMIAA
jgi:hypothetical protein